MDIKNNNIWRKDITGLRALAVIPVLIFHAFPEYLPGGFYGVDVFFVISGYLISGIIFRGLVNNSFSFKDFYFKRIKRIAPNLILVMLFVLLLGWLVTTAGEYKKIGANVSHSAFFYQNFTLMREEDYFGVLAQNNPLLHIWSLSIEEQFYLLFPVLCYLIWKIGKRSIFGLGIFIIGFTICSFFSCLLILDQTFKFYFSFSRFWELGVGICIAYGEIFANLNIRRYERRSTDFLSIFGFLLIVVSFVLPTNWYGPSPGFFSLVPVMGSAILILSNTNAFVNRTILSWGGVSLIGLLSYSLYLWHWPLLTYLRIVFSQPTLLQLSGALVLSFLISLLAYRFVENPVRKCKNNQFTILILLVLLCISYFSGKIIREQDGFPDREMAVNLSFKDDFSYPQGLVQYPKLKDLLVTNAEKIPEIIFVGDSHMEQYHARILQQASLHRINIGFVTEGGCMMSSGRSVGDKKCKKGNALKLLSELLKDHNVKTLVFAQKWGGYEKDILESGLKIYKNLAISFKEEDHSRKVYVLLDNPWDESKSGDFDIEKHISNRFMITNKSLEVFVNLPTDDSWESGNNSVKYNLEGEVDFIDTWENICPGGRCNLVNYKDNDHLRSSYVSKHATWIDQIFKGSNHLNATGYKP